MFCTCLSQMIKSSFGNPQSLSVLIYFWKYKLLWQVIFYDKTFKKIC